MSTARLCRPGRPGTALALIPLLVCSWTATAVAQSGDPLPSWNDTRTKQAIVNFVSAVTTVGSPDYVAPEDRIATFDNDGTLWIEKPLYIHFFAVFEHMKKQMEADPSLKKREPYKSLATKQEDYFISLYENASYETILGELIEVPFGGMTTDEFAAWGSAWLSTWKHPRFNVGYRNLAYRPMVELIDYLEANGFTVHIFTADEAAFLRLAAEDIYGLEPEQVHGSSVRIEYVVEGGVPLLVRTYRAHYLDNWAAKPRLIMQSLGKRPILAAGNSNGDQHMLQWVAMQDGPSLSLLIQHTDGEREYAYDSHTDKVMPMAQREGWTVIDMKTDWKTVFP